MSKAAEAVYGALRNDSMQAHMELYEVLNYHSCENELDELFGKEDKS